MQHQSSSSLEHTKSNSLTSKTERKSVNSACVIKVIPKKNFPPPKKYKSDHNLKVINSRHIQDQSPDIYAPIHHPHFIELKPSPWYTADIIVKD